MSLSSTATPDEPAITILSPATSVDPTTTVEVDVPEVAVVTTASNYTVLLTPGNSHILAQVEAVALAEEDTSPSFGTLENLASIQVKPVGVSFDPQVSVFVAAI